MSEPTIIYQSSETQYWYDEGGSMLCQYKPELWREGYSSETFGVSMNETELVTALTLATQRAESAEAERDALRKDAARLNWLEVALCTVKPYDPWRSAETSDELDHRWNLYHHRIGKGFNAPTFRGVIDAALAVQP